MNSFSFMLRAFAILGLVSTLSLLSNSEGTEPAVLNKNIYIPKRNILMQLLADPLAYKEEHKKIVDTTKPYYCLKPFALDGMFMCAYREDNNQLHRISTIQSQFRGCAVPQTRRRGLCYSTDCDGKANNPPVDFLVLVDIPPSIKTQPSIETQPSFTIFGIPTIKTLVGADVMLQNMDPGALFNQTIVKSKGSISSFINHQFGETGVQKYICRVSSIPTSVISVDFNVYDYMLEEGCLLDTAPGKDGVCLTATKCSNPESYRIRIEVNPRKLYILPLALKDPATDQPKFDMFVNTISNSAAYEALTKVAKQNFNYLCYIVYDPTGIFEKTVGDSHYRTYEFQGARYLTAPNTDSTAKGKCTKTNSHYNLYERFRIVIKYGWFNTAGTIVHANIQSRKNQVEDPSEIPDYVFAKNEVGINTNGQTN